jgi:hypothetical protein
MGLGRLFMFGNPKDDSPDRLDHLAAKARTKQGQGGNRIKIRKKTGQGRRDFIE